MKDAWELVVVWDTGETDAYRYSTEAGAIEGGRRMRMAFGRQVAWHGVRRAR